MCLFAAVCWSRWPVQPSRVPRWSAATSFRRRWAASLRARRRPPPTASTAAARPTPWRHTARWRHSGNVGVRWSSRALTPITSTAAAWTLASGPWWRPTTWTAATVEHRASASMTICSCHFHTVIPLTASADMQTSTTRTRQYGVCRPLQASFLRSLKQTACPQPISPQN